jgi:DNA-binding NarL/FixJ family response regulator
VGDIRVVLADDHAGIRRGISLLLQEPMDVLLVGEASEGQAALDLVENVSPDVLLVDASLPPTSGPEIARELNRAKSLCRVLLMSVSLEKRIILEARESGAWGYIIKDEVPELLITAIREVARGEEWWSPMAIQILGEEE